MKLRDMTALSFEFEAEYFVEVTVYGENFWEDDTNIRFSSSNSKDRDVIVMLLKGLKVINGKIMVNDIDRGTFDYISQSFPKFTEKVKKYENPCISSIKFGNISLAEVKLL